MLQQSFDRNHVSIPYSSIDKLVSTVDAVLLQSTYRQVGIAAVLVSVLLKNRYHKLSNFIIILFGIQNQILLLQGILRNLRILQLFLNFFTSLQSIFCLKISRYNFFQKLAGSNTKKSSLCRKNDTDRHPGIDTTRRIDYFQRSIVRKVSILQSIQYRFFSVWILQTFRVSILQNIEYQ